MPKRIPLRFFLLFGVILAGVPAQAAMNKSPAAFQALPTAQQGIATTLLQMAAEQPAATATLTLKDLPAGFTELPPEIATSLSSRLEMLSQQLGQGKMKPENFFAFVNPTNFQIVLGFTNKIPNQPEQASFDANLQQLSKPEIQQQMLSQLQERVKKLGDIKVTEYKTLPEMNSLANASTGITMVLEMKGQPLRLDCAAFRRNSIGAFTAVMYPNGEQPKLVLGEVARKLDGRIVQIPAGTNR